MSRHTKLALEALENRSLPSSTNLITLNEGVLDIVVDPGRSHAVVVSQPTPDTVTVQIDNRSRTLTGAITQLNYQGSNRNDRFTNLTSLPGNLQFGDGNNLVLSKAARETITAGDGNNVIQDLAGGSTVTVGDGENSIYGGPGDKLTAGSGKNVIYDILGTNEITVAAHRARDYIFTNAQSTVIGAQANDRVARFFAANRQPGSGSLILDQGVLYFTANNSGDRFTLNQVGRSIVAIYDLNDGAGTRMQSFKRSDVMLVANFGGSGNDVFTNNTAIPDVQYGAGGQNTITGGFGDLDLEKAGGAAGTSTAVGRSWRYNDLTGSGTTNVLTTLVVNPLAHDVIRSNNPADQISGLDFGDILIGTYVLKRIAG